MKRKKPAISNRQQGNRPKAAPAVIFLVAYPVCKFELIAIRPCIRLLALLLFLSLILFSGCAAQSSPQYTKDGKVYGVTRGLFRNRWWNFYERGVSFGEGGFYREAIADFQEAIKRRDRDQRRARSYGMHFLDYFPHREMGIALYYLQHYPEAIKELETSLTQEESAKAKYFLNKAREVLLVSQSGVKEPPRIQIISPEDGGYTNLLSVEVNGKAEDEQFVSQIEIKGTPLFIELAQKSVEFKQKVDLHEGINLISVKAKDLTGGESEEVIRVIVDRQGPLFSVEEVKVEQKEKSIIGIRCSLADETGVVSFNLQDKKIEGRGRKEMEIVEKVILKTGEELIPFEAQDLAGNVTSGKISLSSLQRSLSPHIQVALLGERFRDLSAGLFSKDMATPSLTLRLKDLTEWQKVYYETILIDGSVDGSCEIRSILINGTPLFVKPAKNLFFNHLAQLKEGENRFEIKVTDKAGNSVRKNIVVIRETPKVKKINCRMSILLLPFESKGQVSSVGDIVLDALTCAFVKQGRFNLISREKLEEVLRELKLSRTELIDPSKALKSGRMIAAEGVITGSILETKNSIEIYARLINPETTTVLAAKDVFSQEKSISNLQFLSEGLALKFKHSFPLVDGQVVKVKGKEVYTDVGLNKNVKREMKYIIYREGEKIYHPVTGKFLGCESNDLGEVQIEEVFSDFSRGKLLTKEKADIRVKDNVITK